MCRRNCQGRTNCLVRGFRSRDKLHANATLRRRTDYAPNQLMARPALSKNPIKRPGHKNIRWNSKSSTHHIRANQKGRHTTGRNFHYSICIPRTSELQGLNSAARHGMNVWKRSAPSLLLLTKKDSSRHRNGCLGKRSFIRKFPRLKDSVARRNLHSKIEFA